MYLIILYISAFSFLYYGFVCLLTRRMESEFQRYGLSDLQRRLTGLLQLLGSLGLFVGLFYPVIALVASGGLSLLMLLGFLTRLRIKDSLLQSFPSFFFMLLNLYLAFHSFERLGCNC